MSFVGGVMSFLELSKRHGGCATIVIIRYIFVSRPLGLAGAEDAI